MIGRDLGNYHIESQLGAGGMGAVYRAKDVRTGQIVALKTLLGSAMNDAERRKRFQQEARLASSLKHPNIIAIYEIGSAQAEAGESLDYIAMELVEGETLEHLTADHPLPETQAIAYGIQIADGLAAAHAANIVHRDLKPSNIMVGSDGVIKILDFGLAKWTDPIQPDAFSETKSVELGLTMAGTIIGSVAYMSPEQAEGKLLDSRSDVFSFGSLLYRILSGREPFKGASQVATLSAVLLKEPDPLSDFVPNVDPRLESIIRKCLRKDPAKRWQSMADLRLSLEELHDAALAAPVAAPPASTRRQWLMAGAGLLAGLAPTAYFATRRTPSPTFQRLTFRRGDILTAQFAPRGEVVYSAHWDGAPLATYSSVPGSREARDLGLPVGRVASINSNGEALMLLGEEPVSTLVRVGLGGGAPRPVLEDVWDAKWAPDGNSIAVVRRVQGAFRLEFPIGNVLYQSDVRPPSWLRIHPQDGTIVFFDFDVGIADYDVKTVDSAKQVKVLSRGWRTLGRLAWSPDGKEVWISAGRPGESPSMTAISRDGKERSIVQLPGFVLFHDIAPDGSLLLANMRSKIALRALGSLSKQELDLSWFDASLAYEISPDGQSVMSVELAYGEHRNAAIYIRKTDGSPAVRIGFGNRPALSPDGKSIACIFREENTATVKILATGAGEERTLANRGQRYDYVEWFPDNRRLLVTLSTPGKPPRTYWRSVDSDDVHPVTPEGVRGSKVSPDARWVVGVVDGVFRAYPIEGGTPKDLAPAQPADQLLRWTADGKGLYVATQQASNVIVAHLDLLSKRRTPVHEIRLPEEGAEFSQMAISPDGKWYAYSYQKDLAELYLARGIQ